MANSLEQQIQEKEKDIERQLKETGVIDDIEFHDKNYFSIRFRVYNNPDVRKIVDECCRETSQRIKEEVLHIKEIQEENNNGEYERRIEIEPTIKDKNPIISEIVGVIDESLRTYLAKNEHQKAIAYYRKLRQRRTRRWN